MSASTAIFPPSSAGVDIAWENEKIPMFKTLVADSEAGTESRLAMRTFPRYKFVWSYPKLEDELATTDALNRVMGFFLARHGRHESFLIRDTAEDRDVTDQVVGVGNDAQVQFQLIKTIGGVFTETVKTIGHSADIPGFAPNSLTVKLDTTTQTEGVDFDYNGQGIVQFNTAPATLKQVKASFQQYHRVRFMDDESDFEHFMIKLWRWRQVEMITVLGEEALAI